MSRLPLGWASTRLEDVVEILDSQRIPLNSSERQARIAGKDNANLIPYYGATGQVGLIDSHIFDGDLVLLGEDGVPFLDLFKHKAYRITGKSWVNNHAHVLRARAEVTISGYVEGYLNSFDYTGVVTGSTRLKLTQAAMREIPINIAPLSEQKRISEKLDALLARVDATRERLDRVPALLKRFRRSVLAAATSGELTEGWRDGECEAWEEATIGDITVDLRYGTSKKCHYQDYGTAVFRIPNIAENGRISSYDLKRAEFDANEASRLRLEAGDLLLIRSNGSLDLVGKTAVVTSSEAGLLFAGYLMRLRLQSKKVLPQYAYYGLSSPAQRNQIEITSKSTSGVNNINSEELRALRISLPSINEQAEIIRRVEALFAMADKVQAQYEAARARVDRLASALLAKAFRGELVPQDPNDEPASVLLERLQRGRVSAPKPVKKRRRSSATVRSANKGS